MTGPSGAIRRLFIAASAAWAAALPGATAASSMANPPAPVYALTGLVFLIGSAVCHQRPERSFHAWGRQFPVCARCTGIYAAAAIVSVGLLFTHRPRPAVVSSRSFRIRVGVAALAVNALTLIYEWTTGTMPSNVTRAAAGAALGAVVAAFIVNDVD
jgi:uncharacterized membrane protein